MKTLLVICTLLTICQISSAEEGSVHKFVESSSTLYAFQESCMESKLDVTPPQINVLRGEGWPSSVYFEVTDTTSGVYAVAVEYAALGEGATTKIFTVTDGELPGSFLSFGSLRGDEISTSYTLVNKQLFYVKGLDYHHSFFISAVDTCGNISRQRQIRKQDHEVQSGYNFEMGFFERD